MGGAASRLVRERPARRRRLLPPSTGAAADDAVLADESDAMVARNFGCQELPQYVRLLQDDLLALEDSMKQPQQQVYYDLNAMQE